MISDFLSKRPKEKTTKYLLFFSFPLVIVTASTVMYLLELSKYPGTLNETNSDLMVSILNRVLVI